MINLWISGHPIVKGKKYGAMNWASQSSYVQHDELLVLRPVHQFCLLPGAMVYTYYT